jgi:NTP pyrophosphatase (non-canonical NTP hydrolase)
MNPKTLDAIDRERLRQDEKWGIQNHSPYPWLVILMKEVGEAAEAALKKNYKDFRMELVEVAAVAVAAIESLDRNELKK